MSSTPPIPSSSASAVQVKTGNGVTSTNVQAALVELQGEIVSAGGVAELKAAVHYDGDYSALSLNNTSDNSAALQSILTAAAGKIISLPEGIINIDGTLAATDGTNYHILQLPANTTLRGSGDGTTIRIRNPRTATASQRLLWMRDGSTLENITIICDPTTPPTAQLLTLVAITPDLNGFVAGSTARHKNITLRNVKIYGPGQTQTEFRNDTNCLAIYYAKDTTLESCDIRYSSGSGFGIHAIGFDGLRIRGCNISENAADGLKYFGDTLYGASKRLFVQDTKLNLNGQVNIQGQTVGTLLTENVPIPNGASPARYRISTAAANVSVALPTRASVASGTKYLISKVIGSPQPVTLVASGSDTITGFGAASNAIIWSPSNATDKHVLLLTATTGGWTSTQFTNGEGADGSCDGFVFMNCEADGNESSGFQSKNDTTSINKCRDGMYVGCRASNSWFGNGFGIVQNGGTARPVMSNIAVVDSVSYGNYGTGLIVNSQDDGTGSYGLIIGVTIEGFLAASNLTAGVSIQRDVLDVVGSDIRLYGNGSVASPSSCYNMKLIGARNVRLSGLTMMGVDPTAGGLGTEVAIDAATPVCRGLYLERDIAGLTMSNVVIDNIYTRNHNGSNDYLYYVSSGVQGSATDFEQYVTINKTPIDTETWRASDASTSTVIRIGNPVYNILEDRTKENQGIISGAYQTQQNKIAGIMSHRWIFGGYDNEIREAIASYLFGSNHSVVMPSTSGHSFIAGGGTNTMLTNTGECGMVIAGAGCTLGKYQPSAIGSRASSVVGNYSTVTGSNTTGIGIAPDLTTSGRSGLITASTMAANPVPGQTITANGTNYTQSGTVTFDSSTDTVSWSGHGLSLGDTVSFTTTGALPTATTAFAVSTNYYVVGTSGSTFTSSLFQISATRGGTAINFTNNGTATTTARKMNVVLTFPRSATVTFTDSGANDVVAWTAHGLQVGDSVIFTGGTFPTGSGITTGTVYYVQNISDTTANSNVGANGFTISLYHGGPAITWSDAGTGPFTAISNVCNTTPLEFLITSVSSNTTFSYVEPFRNTFQTYAPVITANQSWAAGLQGYSADATADGYNSINNSINSHIERGSYNRISSGYNSRARAHVLGGQYSQFSDIFGQQCNTVAAYQSARGWAARPYNPTQHTVAGGFVRKPGDFQYTNNLFMYNTTTDATPNVILYTQGAFYNTPLWNTNVYILANSLWIVEGQMIAAASMSDFKTWTFRATVKSGTDNGGFGQLTMMSLTKTLDYSSGSAWDWTLDNGLANSTVTFNDSGSNDVVTWASHGRLVGDQVMFTTTGSLPTGAPALNPNQWYYVVNVSDTGTNPNVGTGAFAISATPGGTPLTFTGTGSGTHTAYSNRVFGTTGPFVASVKPIVMGEAGKTVRWAFHATFLERAL